MADIYKITILEPPELRNKNYFILAKSPNTAHEHFKYFVVPHIIDVEETLVRAAIDYAPVLEVGELVTSIGILD